MYLSKSKIEREVIILIVYLYVIKVIFPTGFYGFSKYRGLGDFKILVITIDLLK